MRRILILCPASLRTQWRDEMSEKFALPFDTVDRPHTFEGLVRFFEDAVTRLMNEPRTARPWSPPVDILETEDNLTLKADLPGIAAAVSSWLATVVAAAVARG